VIKSIPTKSDLSSVSLEEACLQFLRDVGSWPKVLVVGVDETVLAHELADKLNLQVAIVPMEGSWWAVSDARNSVWSMAA